jgi:hypothetical protein
MNDLSAKVTLSQPTVADGAIHFSAFGPGWGYCSYAVPVEVAIQRLGAKDPSESQLHLAFQLNRQRITTVIAEGGAQDPHKRAILSKI